MALCIPKFAADKLIKALPEDISKLTDISSAERRKFFEEHVGPEMAKELNAQIESKLILKDQQRGLVNWIDKLAGLTKEAKRDLASKVERMKEVLTPENKDTFLNDLADKRLGFDVTVEEANKLAQLSKKISDSEGTVD